MSVRKRNTEKGQTAEYHYEFMQSGKRHYGVCEGCTTVKAALTYEKSIRETAKKLGEQKSIGALVENFKNELTGGRNITLSEVFDIYSSKPRRRMPNLKQKVTNLRQWNDFCSFMNGTYPEIVQLNKVSKQHAEAYIKHLKDKGRYIRTVEYTQKYKKNLVKLSYGAQTKLCGRTINSYHATIKSIFAKLKEDAGIIYNPFSFDMVDNKSESRDAFSPEELKLIGENLTDFVKPLFIIGICTGLSEGDICNLKWSEIHEGWITRKRRKTGASLDIPILPPLAKFLSEQRPNMGNNEYVLPEHFAMYGENPSGISHRVKNFLEGLGISTTRKIEGRDREISVKDVHSLRHTFAYLAGCYQIPAHIVQSILGHMSPEMTKHYQSHADRKDKEKYLSQLPNFLEMPSEMNKLEQPIEPEKFLLQEIIKTLPLNTINKILKFIEENR